jgi:hypothetical protein
MQNQKCDWPMGGRWLNVYKTFGRGEGTEG